MKSTMQIKNRTWRLVPRPYGANVITSMWLYKYKHDAEGVITRPKARLVANGKTQEEGIDFDEAGVNSDSTECGSQSTMGDKAT